MGGVREDMSAHRVAGACHVEALEDGVEEDAVRCRIGAHPAARPVAHRVKHERARRGAGGPDSGGFGGGGGGGAGGRVATCGGGSAGGGEACAEPSSEGRLRLLQAPAGLRGQRRLLVHRRPLQRTRLPPPRRRLKRRVRAAAPAAPAAAVQVSQGIDLGLGGGLDGGPGGLLGAQEVGGGVGRGPLEHAQHAVSLRCRQRLRGAGARKRHKARAAMRGGGGGGAGAHCGDFVGADGSVGGDDTSGVVQTRPALKRALTSVRSSDLEVRRIKSPSGPLSPE